MFTLCIMNYNNIPQQYWNDTIYVRLQWLFEKSKVILFDNCLFRDLDSLFKVSLSFRSSFPPWGAHIWCLNSFLMCFWVQSPLHEFLIPSSSLSPSRTDSLLKCPFVKVLAPSSKPSLVQKVLGPSLRHSYPLGSKFPFRGGQWSQVISILSTR